jgi:acetyl/propionyl-CoA carboxylase alpha subunit
MQKTLSECVVFGVSTNIPYLQKLLALPEFIEGRMTTRTIDNHYPKGLPPEGLSRFEKTLARELEQQLAQPERASGFKDPWVFQWK